MLILQLLTVVFVVVKGQFGVPNTKSKSSSSTPLPESVLESVSSLSQNDDPELEQLLVDINAIVVKAKADPQTREMVTRLRTEMAHEVRELEQKSVDEILSGMREVINNMKLIDYLFKDKERAVAEMEREEIESTRLNSSHITISYAVFCLKKKKKYT